MQVDRLWLGDDHAAVDDPRHVSAAAAFPESRRAEASQAGVGHRPRVGCAEGRGQRGRDKGRRAPANRRATVIMVCREAWSALASSSRGVSFRWTGRSARLDSHVWDAG
jgi:hypothetical protein